ncbi:MAG: GNAT family N-acetyltransferase [Fimbriimonas sp.]
MSHIDVRPIQPEDMTDAFDVVSRTYRNGDTIENPESWLDGCETFVGTVDGKVLGLFQAAPMTATRGPALLSCGGIGLVCVAPEARRSGLGSAMMRHYVRTTPKLLSSLYAFRETFYRKAGYEVCGKRLKITVPVGRLARPEAELEGRLLRPESWREISECYGVYAHQRSGLHIRDEAGWKHKLAENKRLAIYAVGDPIEAYAAVSHDSSFWNDQFISELVWSSRRGYESILAFMHGLGINKNGLAWNEPSDSPYYARFLDQGVQVAVERPIMFRVNRVAAALEALKPTEEGTFSFQIRDDVVPANNGPWRVSFSPEGLTVEESAEADFVLDIRQFVQAFLGEPSLAELVQQDMVEILSNEGLSEAMALLGASPTVCNDFF